MVRGWISPEGVVQELELDEGEHYDPEVIAAILGLPKGTDPVPDPIRLGWVRFLTSDGSLLVHGRKSAIENLKHDIFRALKNELIDLTDVWVDIEEPAYRESAGRFEVDDFIETDWREHRRSILAHPNLRAPNQFRGKGWWGNRPGHQIAARLGKLGGFRRYD